MALFVVSYDLRKKKDYQPLWDEMDRLGGHKPLESVYFLNVNSKDAATLIAHLRKFIDDDDQVIAVEFDKRPGTLRAKSGTKEWLDKYF